MVCIYNQTWEVLSGSARTHNSKIEDETTFIHSNSKAFSKGKNVKTCKKKNQQIKPSISTNIFG